MTEVGYQMGLEGRCGIPCYATVVRMARDGAVVVVRDGLVTPEPYHVDFWRSATPTTGRDE